MIVYKVQDQTTSDVNNELRSLMGEVASIAPTLQRLRTVIEKHDTAISSPSISKYRSDIQAMITEATSLTERINNNSHMLIEVSEQAGKHLKSVEEHYDTLLNKSPTL